MMLNVRYLLAVAFGVCLGALLAKLPQMSNVGRDACQCECKCPPADAPVLGASIGVGGPKIDESNIPQHSFITLPANNANATLLAPVLDFTAACSGVPEAMCTAADRMAYWMQKYGGGCQDPYWLVWWGRNLTHHDKTGIEIPTMSRVSRFLVMTGAAVSAGADVIEMGTYMGRGSLALSAGLSSSAALRHGRPPVHHGFDFFKATAMQLPKIRRVLGNSMGGLKPGGSYTRYWTELLHTVYPHVRAHPGSIGGSVARSALEWDDAPVDIFSIDSAKTHEQLKSQSSAVWKNLRKGSIIVFMDFAKSAQPLLVYHVLKPSGMVKLAWLAIVSSPAAFYVTTDDVAFLKKAVYDFKPNGMSSVQREAAFESFLAEVDGYAAIHLSGPNNWTRTGTKCLDHISYYRDAFFDKHIGE